MSLQETRPDEFSQQMAEIQGFVAEVLQPWFDAPTKVTQVPPRPGHWDLAASIRRGRELFTGNIANCAKCHGPQGRGDGQTTDFDDWTKEIVDPQKPDAADQYRAVGALAPQHILPRNFRLGVFRGGSRPSDLYVRIHNGIAGTPMPAAPLKPDGAAPDDLRLNSDDLWHLVDYVLSLSSSRDSSLSLTRPSRGLPARQASLPRRARRREPVLPGLHRPLEMLAGIARNAVAHNPNRPLVADVP
jgi:mono/diheme cytochrome c family protein